MNITEEGRKLAFQAIREQSKDGQVTVVCPKCLEHHCRNIIKGRELL